MLVNIRLNGCLTSSNDCVLEESSCCTHKLRLSLLCRRQLRCVRRTGGTDGEEGKEEGQEDVSCPASSGSTMRSRASTQASATELRGWHEPAPFCCSARRR